ncbi:MAG: hypothetical protein O3A25_20525, partial [Acidobacteria bacterium]|nr:hypothetical protein [Acidobacteriota bacterium]
GIRTRRTVTAEASESTLTAFAVSFWVPALGGRSLSTNARGAKRNPHAISAAKYALGDATYFSVLAQLGPDVPHIDGRADVFLDYHICFNQKLTRNVDDCYRFTDPSNGGGDVAKPIMDYGVVRTGILDDDNYKHVRFFTCGITPVETLAEEGVRVTVTEVEGE